MDVTSPYIDISPVLRSGIAVFPGDTPFKRKINMSFGEGQNLDLSAIETTLHVGAHTDAPSHYHSDGKTIEERDLKLYMGPCQVIEVMCEEGARIGVQDLKVGIIAPRILFKTNSFSDPDKWKDEFNTLSPELVKYLFDHGVVLIGIDTPSVDPVKDKTIVAHKAIYERDMAILEGIILTHVKPGLYQLIALPLRIEGGDASPVRAILLDTGKN
ncbi:MAG TPA: cyclase family protein [Bacteriovoracaceae bacterium]|nr:cyclase family protein [Bacteriovoracaceae bacterium]